MTETAKISTVTPEQMLRLNQHCQEWLEIATLNAQADRVQAEAAIRALYKLRQLSEPTMIWCQSTWQMRVYPFIIPLILQSSSLRSSLKNLTEKAESKKWQALWLQLSQLPWDAISRIDHSAVFDPLSSNFRIASASFSASMNMTLPNKLAGLVNACFDKSSGPELRHRYDGEFRNRLKRNVLATLRADQALRDTKLLIDELGFQLSEQRGADLWQVLNTQASLFDSSFIDFSWSPGHTWWGASSTPRLPLYEFISNSFFTPNIFTEDSPELNIWCLLARSAAAYSFYARYCVVCDYPIERHLDERGRTHNQNGPAVSFADGHEIYVWHGTTVPEWIIRSPETISLQSIDSEENVEVCRVMIDRFGMGRFLRDSGSFIIHQDTYGVLYGKQLGNEGELMVTVRVVNSMPEPDGSNKEYFLRVPPI
jgi:hypothetical protein